jgi:hypothetical protein
MSLLAKTGRAALVAGLCALAPMQALAGPVLFDTDWNEQRFSLFSGNSYGLEGARLSVASDRSVSLIWQALPQTEWAARSAQWSWRVERSVPATDLQLKGGDDRNLSLYFVFLPEQEARGIRSMNVRRLLTNENARVLVYVWGGDHARRAFLSSPYLGPRGTTVVQRQAGTGAFSESVDLQADYIRAFGGTPGALVGLAVSGDSDDTDTAIRAEISNLSLG